MPSAKDQRLSANEGYDNNATMVNSDLDSDNESSREHDHPDVNGRESVQEDDRGVLEEADEQERLLSRPTRFDAVKDVFNNAARREARRRRRAARRSTNRRKSNQESTLMFELEEGFKDTSSRSSSDFADSDAPSWQDKADKVRSIQGNGMSLTVYKFTRRRRRLGVIYLVVGLLSIGLAFGVYKASRSRSSSIAQTRFWNGTHTFKPTTILISLDGFRADFLNQGLTPTLNAFIASGVSPLYMLPSFPTITFPNHFTLVTGLYPESHGIVGNQFWDPEFHEEFYYTDVKHSMQPKWWTAEPIWVTAENQGVRTAVHMWPGSEAHIPDVEPTYVDKFNESESLTRKVDRLLRWIDMPSDDDAGQGDKRPQLLLAYVPNVDADGHQYGPNSTEIRGTIADVDSMLTILVEGLFQRNLTEIVNLVVVSDHGMATTSTQRLIQLDDLIDMSLVDHIDGWPLRGLRLKNPERDVPILYRQLLKEAQRTGTFEVYTLDTMPERYHFTQNQRIAPLWVIPKTGWAVVEKVDFDIAEARISGKQYTPLGLHGYDHEHPLMRSIFVARGPSFPHPPNSRVSTFQNIEVYNIVCDSLGIKAHPNNGTLHLPLKTEGLHSDSHAPELDTPPDASDDVVGDASLVVSLPPQSASHTSPTAINTLTPTSHISPTADHPSSAPSVPTSKPVSNVPAIDENPSPKTSWWSYLHDQLQKAKEWAKEFVESIKHNRPDQKDAPPSP